jgi:hypothetical protein
LIHFWGAAPPLSQPNAPVVPCYGLEIDPGYVDIIIRRWQAFTKLDAVHATSGRSFNDLEAEISK